MAKKNKSDKKTKDEGQTEDKTTEEPTGSEKNPTSNEPVEEPESPAQEQAIPDEKDTAEKKTKKKKKKSKSPQEALENPQGGENGPDAEPKAAEDVITTEEPQAAADEKKTDKKKKSKKKKGDEQTEELKPEDESEKKDTKKEGDQAEPAELKQDRDEAINESEKSKKKKKKKNKQVESPDQQTEPHENSVQQAEETEKPKKKKKNKERDSTEDQEVMEDEKPKKKKGKKKQERTNSISLEAESIDQGQNIEQETGNDEVKEKKDGKGKSKNKVKSGYDEADQNIPPMTEKQYEQLMEMARVFGIVKRKAKEHNIAITKASKKIDKVDELIDGLERIQNNTQLIWKIPNFRSVFARARDGTKKVLYSPVLDSHKNGYKVGISLCPFGDGKGAGSHMSLFFSILQGPYDDLLPWPFNCPLRFTLLDQGTRRRGRRKNIVGIFYPNPTEANKPYLGQPTTFRNPSLGLPKFVSLDDLWNEADRYVADNAADNAVFIKVEVDISNVLTG